MVERHSALTVSLTPMHNQSHPMVSADPEEPRALCLLMDAARELQGIDCLWCIAAREMPACPTCCAVRWWGCTDRSTPSFLFSLSFSLALARTIYALMLLLCTNPM
jgi:hypothetical protein